MVLACLSGAKAITLSGVEPVPGGPVIADSGVSVALSSIAISIAGGPTGVASGGTILIPIPGLVTTASLGVAGPSITGGSFTTINVLGGGSLFLAGNLLDANFGTGVLELLFAIGGGSAASEFGDLVQFSLASPSFGPGTLGSLPQPPNVDTLVAPLTISSVQVIAVPEPAALSSFAIGLGLLSIFAIRRKRSIGRGSWGTRPE